MASMTSLSAGRRSPWSKAVGILLLAMLASLAVSPSLLREWHAWWGYHLFLDKRFDDASSHSALVGGGATLVAAHYGLPSMKHLHAQSLLVTGRSSEAVLQYSELADLEPDDATLAFIMALHDGTRSNWESAAARLVRHKDSAGCQPCKVAHAKFQAAALALAKVIRAQREQEVLLTSMKRPALCFGYRVGSAAASALADQVLGFVEPVMVRHLRAAGMTKRATEKAVSFAAAAMGRILGDVVEDVETRALGLGVSCARSVQLHQILHLESIPYVARIEEWVEFKVLEEYVAALPYVGSAKDALEIGVQLRDLGALSFAYAKAYEAEGGARGLVAEADGYAKSQWDIIRNAAQTPEFTREGVALFKEGLALVPREKSWLETIQPYVWPF